MTQKWEIDSSDATPKNLQETAELQKLYSSDDKTYDDKFVVTKDKTLSSITKKNATVQRVKPEAKQAQPKVVETNPFRLLDVYPDPSTHVKTPLYNKIQFGIENDDRYCQAVDFFNLQHPEKLFTKNAIIWTDFNKNSMVERTARKYGSVPLMKYHHQANAKKYETSKKTTTFDPNIVNFYLSSDAFWRYHKIGQHYLCETQMYNHIPGHGALVRKDELNNNIQNYVKRYEGQPQCFDPSKIFPSTFRLFSKLFLNEFFIKIFFNRQGRMRSFL